MEPGAASLARRFFGPGGYQRQAPTVPNPWGPNPLIWGLKLHKKHQTGLGRI